MTAGPAILLAAAAAWKAFPSTGSSEADVDSALNALNADGWWIFGLTAAAASWVFGGAFVRLVAAALKDKDLIIKESPAELLGCTQVLHRVLHQVSGTKEPCEESRRCRITIYRVDHAKKVCEQIIPYMGRSGGGGGHGEPGLQISFSKGIVGKAARKGTDLARGDCLRAKRTNDDYEGYIREMVEDWGFTQEEARLLSPDRFAWLAVPLYSSGGGDDEPYGIVYFDSDMRDFFSDELVLSVALRGCFGIAAYADARYSKDRG